MCARKNQIFKLRLHWLLLIVFVFACAQHTTDALTRPLDRNAHTIYYQNTPPDVRGHFHYEFQTSNGITIKSAGNEHGFSGVVQFVSLEGVPITMTYTADEDGYHPSGEHIPSVPAHVAKALEYIKTHPQVDEKKSRKM